MDLTSSVVSATVPTKNVNFEDTRQSVTYHPTVWGDYFLRYASNITELSLDEEEQLQKQKEELRKLLEVMPENSPNKTGMIDAIQRLGLGYHFETEIENYLCYMYETYPKCNDEEDDHDLHLVALCFRLLRQQGYYVPCDVFQKFKDGEGKFKESLTNNVQGMLSLYEAAHYVLHGEEILDEALEFCSTHLLQLMALDTSNSLIATQVNEALRMPIQKTLTRLGAKKFISFYQQDESHNKALLDFARFDFNLLQKMHQKELCEITRWWKDLDFENKLPFARNRVVECYFWILGVYFKPQYKLARRILTKVISMASIIDDIYDVYGTPEDLQLFTDAIQRWHFSALDQLPEYMRFCYRALLDVYTEAEEELKTTGRSYRVSYAIEEMKKLVRAYHQEAKWVYSKIIPSVEEYMKVALVSGAYMMLSTTSLVGMGNLVTKQHFDWVTSEPPIVQASSIICRLMDDMVGYGFEQKLTAVDCYMNHIGASKEKTFVEFRKRVSNAWKDINEACLDTSVVPMLIYIRVVNLARIINLLYKDDDEYSNSKTNTKGYIKSILVEPVTS